MASLVVQWKVRDLEIQALIRVGIFLLKNSLCIQFALKHELLNIPLFYYNINQKNFLNLLTVWYITGGVNLRLFEGLFVALDKCTRVLFSFLCYYIFKNYYRSICVSKCLLNY